MDDSLEETLVEELDDLQDRIVWALSNAWTWDKLMEFLKEFAGTVERCAWLARDISSNSTFAAKDQ